MTDSQSSELDQLMELADLQTLAAADVRPRMHQQAREALRTALSEVLRQREELREVKRHCAQSLKEWASRADAAESRAERAEQESAELRELLAAHECGESPNSLQSHIEALRARGWKRINDPRNREWRVGERSSASATTTETS